MADKKTIKRNKKLPLKAKNRRTFFGYSQDTLRRALFEIRNNQCSIRKASNNFGVPRSTLQDIINGKVSEHKIKRTGPPPILTWEGEEQITKWLVEIAKCGFPIKKNDLLNTVKKICEDSGKSHLFKNNMPGQKWYSGFLRRHPEISLREAESINKARAIVTEESVRKWFSDLQSFLETNGLLEVMENPKRIFNGDESGFSLCPKTGKVLAPKGFKNLYKITSGKEKENITVFLIFSADGQVCPPFVVFPYIRPPRALVESMPPTWIFGKSEKGWMTAETFFEYISNAFNNYLIEQKIEKPVIVFLDGHKSHMSLPLSEFCDSNGIILYALPPNTTHILQPADVSVFKPLKQQWKNTIGKWLNRPENINSSVTKLNFCNLFQDTLKANNTTPQIINGFRKCGLFPLNPDSVDFTKCVKNALENQWTNSVELKGIASEEDNLTANDLEISIRVIKRIEPQLYSYGLNVQVIYNEINELSNVNAKADQEPEFEELFSKAQKDIEHIAKEHNTNTDFLISNVIEEHETETNHVEIIANEITENVAVINKVPHDKICILEDIVIKLSDTGEITKEIDESQFVNITKEATESKDYSDKDDENNGNIIVSLDNNASTEKKKDPFETHLTFPEVVKVPGKVKVKLPSAISSQAWRNYYLKKEREKAEKVDGIKRRKEQRLANKNKKGETNNNKKKRAIKAIIENNMNQQNISKTKIKCVKCEEDLISDTEEDQEKNIGCDYCTNWYHLKCTNLFNLSYEVAAAREYKCETCK